jgi:hypothetical protein
MGILSVPPFLSRRELVFAAMDQQDPVDLVGLLEVLVHEEPTRRLTFFSGPKGLELVVKDGVIHGQPLPCRVHLFGGCEALDVGLVAGSHVVCDALHKGGFAGENPNFGDSFSIKHETEYISKAVW